MDSLVRWVVCILCILPISLPTLAQFQEPIPYPNTAFDYDQNGTIDATDLLYFLQRWGLTGIDTPTPTATPIITLANTFTRTPTPTSTETPTPTFSATETPTETPTDPGFFTVDLPPLPTPIPMLLVRIPAGSFMMGSPETERGRDASEGPIHAVTIEYDFYMGQTEVTQAQWQAVMGTNPARENNPTDDFGLGNDHPVYSVSWDDCQDFLTALNALGQGLFRLPSEAEWEYACRAGTTSLFYYGNSLGCPDGCEDCETDTIVIGGKETASTDKTVGTIPAPIIGVPFNLKRSDFMWFCWNADIASMPVRELRSNSFGLFDMSGNLAEWVQDAYHGDYNGAPTDGSAWGFGGDGNAVIRGGARTGNAAGCRSAARLIAGSDGKYSDVGFRVVWDTSPLK